MTLILFQFVLVIFISIAFVSFFRRDDSLLIITLFALPWGSLSVTIGTTIFLGEFFAILYIIRALLVRYSIVVLPTWSHSFFLYLIVSSVIGLLSLLIVEIPEHTFGLSWLQASYGRLIVQLVKWLIWGLFLVIIFRARHPNIDRTAIRAVFYSISLLSGLAILQQFIFLVTGFDIFPIGGLTGESRSSLLEGLNSLRVNSFAGEPKGLAIKCVIALVILVGLTDILAFSRRQRFIFGIVIFSALLQTGSSSGYFILFAAGIVISLRWLFTRDLPRGTAKFIGGMCFVLPLAIYFFIASSVDVLAPQEYRTPSDWVDLVRHQTIERIRLDDSDAIYIAYLMSNTWYLASGFGLGLGHLFVQDWIPIHQQWYMLGTTVPPKSGVTETLVGGGLLGVLLMAVFFSRLVPGGFSARVACMGGRVLRDIQFTYFALILCAGFRIYDFLLICSLMVILQRRFALRTSR